jgi:SAM-dependent methyltransferase
VEPSEYERIARLEGSHFWYRGLHALVLAALARHLPAASAALGGATAERPLILDAGCGPGGLTVQLLALGRVVGLDRSALALQFAATHARLPLLQASVSALPLAAGSVDAVVCLDVLYHRAVPDDRAALAELAAACRPGGLLLLNLPAHAWLAGPHDAQVHTARRYDRAQVRALARAAGLEVVRLSWFNCALLPAAVATRRLSGRRDRPHSDVQALPAPINAPLSAWMRLEAALALRGLLPWGLSLFAVLRRPSVIGPAGPCR